MERNTIQWTVSLPPPLSRQATRIAREESRTKSELIREALRHYMDDRTFLSLQKKVSRKFRSEGIHSERDVERLIDEEEPDPLRVVLDTNVLLSIFGFPGGTLAVLWTMVRTKQIRLFVSDFILEELSRNLVKKADFRPRDVRKAIELILRHSHKVTSYKTVTLIKRKDSDNRILECAAAAKANVLITGDRIDLRPLGSFESVEILTPTEFIDKYPPQI